LFTAWKFAQDKKIPGNSSVESAGKRSEKQKLGEVRTKKRINRKHSNRGKENG
jgi:hypothetical protein